MDLVAATINKISRPRMSAILQRERLFHLLDRGLARPVTWIQGPGGSGKSTLVASYLDSRRLPCIWYRLDEGDSDPATLFHYMQLAAKKAAPGRKPLPLFTPEYQPALTTFSRRYFESLFNRLKPPYVLVFDDYHEVNTASMLHEVMRCGLSEVPEGGSVIVISRTPHPPALARLSSGRKMSFIGWEELRLTAEETAEIVSQHDPTGDWQRAVVPLHEKLDGWVAGLVLILERGKPEELEQWRKGNRTQQEIFDYFAGELFDKEAPEIRDFLLKTALLPEIAPPLAAILTGNPDAVRILAELHTGNFFTERCSDKEAHYRFHPLFREYLLGKSETTYEHRHLAELKQHASTLLEQAGLVKDAAALRIDAEDWEGLSNLILANAPSLIAQGRSGTLLEWLNRMPRSMLEQTPYLLFWHGAALFSCEPVESRARFQQAFSLFRARGDQGGTFLSWCAVVDTAIHASEYVPLKQWVEVLNDLLEEDPLFPSGDTEVRVALSLFNAVAFVLPDKPDIMVIRDRAFELLCTEKIADVNLFLSTGLHLIIHFLYQGDFACAGATLNLLRESARAKEATDLVQITAITIEAHYAFAICALDTCVGKGLEALELADESGVHIWDTHVYGHLLAATLSRGDMRDAEELVGKMAAGLGKDCRRVDKAYYYWLMAWHSALGNNFLEARQFLELSLKGVAEIGFLIPEVAATINMAEVCLELGDHLEADACLEKALPVVESTGSAYLRFSYLITEAYILLKRGDEAQGLDSLGRAFSVGRANRIENFYFWRPVLMAALSVKALEVGIEVDYVRELVLRRTLVPEEPPLHIENWPWPFRMYTLGRFELVKNDKPVVFSGKVQKKPLEMLKVLVALGGKELREGELADLLWPNVDGDTARNSFKVTLHRLRDLLGCGEALRVQDGRLAMDRRYFWTDVWAFERMLNEAQLKGDSEAGSTRLEEKALSLYGGRLFSEDVDRPWAVSQRKRLHNRFIHHVVNLGNTYLRTGDHKQAIACFQKGLEVDDLAEELYQHLMQSYVAAGLCAEAVTTYRRCKKTLAVALHVHPSVKTTAIYETALGC